MNMMAASLACLEKGIQQEELIKGLSTYRRLEHRLEYVGVYGGVHFYNDSIATIPEACVQALETLEKVDLLILGGYDRGLDYTLLYKALRNHNPRELIFMGDAGKRMQEELSGFEGRDDSPGMTMVNSMEKAFEQIRVRMMEGDVCLLSPAAASYGMFSNFEERGYIFKKLAATLK
jgi:UDP-N-acetylmuramoylalanine--D-glutamate ligase